MAENADGSIIVDTEIDTQGFKAGSSELQRAIKSLNNKMEALGPTFQKAVSGNASAVSSFNSKAEALENTISKLEAKMASLGNTQVPTDGYIWLTREIEKANNELNKLYDREMKMENTGVKRSSKAWRSLQYDINLARQKIAEYSHDLEALKASGGAFKLGSSTPEYAALSSQLSAAKQRLAELQAEAKKADASSGKFGKTLQSISKVLTTIGNVGKKAFSSVVGVIKKATSKLKIFNKQTHRSSMSMNTLGGRIKMLVWIMKQMLIMRAFMGIITAIGDGFKNLAQYSQKTNSELSALKSALTQLKNSFATAFAPILTVVTPALTKLINHLSRAINYIGQLFAALTGATTYVRAKEVQEDFAASLEGTAEAAKEAQRSVAGFDELNLHTDQKETGNVSPSEMFEEVEIESGIKNFVDKLKAIFEGGDYASIGTAIGNGINNALQKVKDVISWDSVGDSVTTFIENFASGFNSLVSTIDWAAIGDTFAQGLNTLVNILHLAITEFDWPGVAAGFATGLNGFVNGVDWAVVGQTLSDGFAGALNFIHTAIETFDWQALGTAIATLVANIDWSELFRTVLDIIGDLFTGVLEFRQALHDGLPPELEAVLTLVEDIGLALAAWKISATLIDSINTIVKLLSTGYAGAITIGVILAITGITIETKGIVDAVNSELDGVNFAEIVSGGLLTTGGSAILGAGIAKWVAAAFSSGAVDLALTEAGINLGLGTTTAAGAALGAGIAGIIAGIPAMFVGIYDACKNGIDWLSGLLIPAGATAAGAGIGTIIGACGGPIGAGIGALIGLAVGLVTDGIILIVQNWDVIADWFTKVGNAIGDFFTKTIPGAFNKFIGWIGTAWENLKSAVAALPETISNWFSNLWQPIKDYDWNALGNKIGTGFGNAVKWAIEFVTVKIPEFFTNLWNTVWGALTTFFTEILPDFFSSVWDALVKFFTVDLPHFFTETLPQAFMAVIDFFKALPEKIWNAIQTGWNWLVDVGKSIIDGIWEGLQTVWQAIKDFVSGFVQGFKDALGIHSPSTVFAEIGTFLIEGLLQGIKNMWGSITEFFTNAVEGIKNLLSGAWESIKQGASAAWSGIKSTVTGAWEGIKSGVSTACTAVKSTVSTAWEGIKSGASTAWNSVKSTVTNAWNGIKSGVSTAVSNVKSTVSTGWNNIKSTVSTVGNNIKSTATTAWNNLKSSVSTTVSNIKSSVSSAWDSMKSTVSTKMSNIKTTVSNSWSSLKTSATTWGKDVCENMANGISKAKSTVESAVKSVASKIKSFLGFSEPEDGPLSNFHTYMPDMIDLMTKGIKDNQSKAIGAVSDMASAISGEIQNGDYAMGGVKVGSGATAALTGFSDKIVDGFATLMERLQHIADNVTFASPVVARSGLVPYGVSAKASRDDGGSGGAPADFVEMSNNVDERMADISYQLRQLIAIVKALNLNIDIDALTEMVTQQQRASLRNFGGV